MGVVLGPAKSNKAAGQRLLEHKDLPPGSSPATKRTSPPPRDHLFLQAHAPAPPYTAVVAALWGSQALELSAEEIDGMLKRKRVYLFSTEARGARTAASVCLKGFREVTKSTGNSL
ncbi:hypothetical protein QBC46DRAFT_424426 [Diplogelasinospora grovesii]|uniref:Uncharacterized protein n=1 Tax=Diplogelasinospora grovesii TaxID=303347 RepID=A0AAN6MZA5_9PEZI|nr:hypothetical protein QBC46DRAFT_424426 [Diplogelasinospora grovesii]